MTTRYMHTLNDQPASFDPNHGGYIHYVGGRNKAQLENDLATIKRQQKQSQKSNPIPARYGYILVEDAQ